ncbi:MAG: hypothetical protein K2W96_20640 [Gemmataceae bacterium]|nr:hypothetical protein [Gemmataceae bacterium]
MFKKVAGVAVLAAAFLMGGPTPKAEAQLARRPAITVPTYAWVEIGAVIERDSSTWVKCSGSTIYHGGMSGIFGVGSRRLMWTNSQRATEWVTLMAGTQAVAVDRRQSYNGRRLIFRCYVKRRIA